MLAERYAAVSFARAIRKGRVLPIVCGY